MHNDTRVPDAIADWVGACLGVPRDALQIRPLGRRPDTPAPFVVDGADARAVLKILPPQDWDCARTEAAALRVAEQHGLPVPRLIAARPDGIAGRAVLLQSLVDGSPHLPIVAPDAMLMAAGATVALAHAVAREPTDALPQRRRHMPWVNFSKLRRSGERPSTELLDRADRVVLDAMVPDAQTVFVHGDMWFGNLLFDRQACVAIIDWDAAGCGPSGVDLGSLRLDAALQFGPDAPAVVLAGWEAAAGRAAADVPYWDVVAAANTSNSMAGSLPAHAAVGRSDLTAELLADRRNAFLANALSRLGA